MTTELIKTESAEVLDPRSTLAIAINKGLDPVTIGKLMDLQERWDANQARKAFVQAMAQFKREAPPVIGKDKRADFGAGKAKYTYATTGAIVTAITPALSKNGLHLSWETEQEGNMITVTCHITHDGGHRESATLTGPKDESGGKNPIQTVGSSVHYLQRYTMVSVLGLATADMDDADDTPQRPPVTMPTAKTEHAKPEGDVARGLVGQVSEKKLPSGKTKYGVLVDGKWYGTFSSTDAGVARDAKTQGKPVALAWLRNGDFYNVASINIEDAGLTDAEKADIEKQEAAGELPL